MLLLTAFCAVVALLLGAFNKPPCADPAIARRIRVASDVFAIAAKLDDYRAAHGQYPAELSGLSTLKLPVKDPWGSDYVYRYPGIRHKSTFDLFSAGPDRMLDTTDDDWGSED